MAARTYEVTWRDVASRLPIDAECISTTSIPVSTIDLTEAIEDGAGRVTGALRKRGIDPDALDDDTRPQVAKAIIWYAVAEALSRMGRTSSSAYTTARARYDETLERFEQDPEVFATTAKSSRALVPDEPKNTNTRSFAGSSYRF